MLSGSVGGSAGRGRGVGRNRPGRRQMFRRASTTTKCLSALLLAPALSVRLCPASGQTACRNSDGFLFGGAQILSRRSPAGLNASAGYGHRRERRFKRPQRYRRLRRRPQYLPRTLPPSGDRARWTPRPARPRALQRSVAISACGAPAPLRVNALPRTLTSVSYGWCAYLQLLRVGIC